jgi:hypothetical protein
MQYLVMHKTTPADEAGVKPSAELIRDMGALIDEMARAGTFLDGGGLRESAQRYRLNRDGARWRVTQGPFGGSNELPAGIAILKTATWDEALDWGRRFGDAVGADELELGLMTEEWDLGFGERPANPPVRALIQHKATQATEAGRAPRPEQRTALAALTVEMVDAGVLQFYEVLRPSADATRLVYRNDDRTVIDGPFTESKELIGGFCLLQMRSLEEVLAMTDRYVSILGGTREIDVRPVAEKGPKSAGSTEGR